MMVTVRLGMLPPAIREEVASLLKNTNPPFSITDDLVITVFKEIETWGLTVEFYRIEANGLIYGCDYDDYAQNKFEVRYYKWSHKHVKSTHVKIEKGEAWQYNWWTGKFEKIEKEESGNIVYCGDLSSLYNLLSSINIIDLITNLKDAELYDKLLIEKFVEENFCKWVTGVEFYDKVNKKWKKITRCGDIKLLSYDIIGNKITIDLDKVLADMFSNSEKIIICNTKREDKRVTKVVKTHLDFYGKKLPVEIVIISGVGISLYGE